MFEKIDKRGKYSLHELINENYTDLDDFREKPLVFKQGALFLVCEPVRHGDYPAFLKQLMRMLTTHRMIFAEFQFLSALNYKDQTVLDKAILQMKSLAIGKSYKAFMKSLLKFIVKWCLFSEQKGEDVIILKSKRQIKRFMNAFAVDEIIHIFLVMVVFNFDMPKKKIIQVLDTFKMENIGRDSTSRKCSKKVLPLPTLWESLSERPGGSSKRGKRKTLEN